MDPGATDHITGELDWLMMHEPYIGTDQIHTTNNLGMEITQIGTSLIPTSRRDLVLNKVLHVPSTHKNLILSTVSLSIMTLTMNFIISSFLLRIEK
jgi:hypothetical protein